MLGGACLRLEEKSRGEQRRRDERMDGNGSLVLIDTE